MYLASRADRLHTRFTRTTNEGKTIWRTDFFGPPPSPQSSDSVRPDATNSLDYQQPRPGERREPQAFLVEQSPGAVVHPHFHFVDQFQVVVEGNGQLGRHDIEPYTVHFAGEHTGYGPILPGQQGLKYFTLRATEDQTGAQYLPANRHKMAEVQRRNIVFDPIAPMSAADLAALTAAHRRTQQRSEDGPIVDVLSLPPGASADIPAHPGKGGRTLIVLEGDLQRGDKHYERFSCGFLEPIETVADLLAGPGGAQVLWLTYPAPRPHRSADHAI